MLKRLEKPQPPYRSEVIELDDALLDLAVGGLDSDLLRDIEITSGDCPRNPPTNSAAHGAVGSTNG